MPMATSMVTADHFQARMNESRSSVVVWCFKDGKRGHENQSLGLLTALGEEHAIEVHNISVAGRTLVDAWRAATRRFPPGENLPTPALHLGAGHQTHLPMLAAKRARGGRIVVLMKPTLPTSWFDLCAIPEHDNPQPRPNILPTRGVINRARSARTAASTKGLILIGGPSAHHDWSQDALLRQIVEITQDAGAMQWTLATSPRTPGATTAALRQLPAGNISLAPFQCVDANWLPEMLEVASQVWVSEDSVSMVYEALTAGAAVGVMSVPQKKSSRVSRGMTALAREGLITSFAGWQHGHRLSAAPATFNEADRCANWITDRWL